LQAKAALLAPFLVLALGEPGHAQANDVSRAQSQGRAIYYGDTGNSLERSTVSIGGMDVSLPAASFPCTSCHGELGVARAERGVTPPDISKQALTRSYRSSEGRTLRPPYTRELFARAVQIGLDSAGQELATSMPRFDLEEEDINALWLFLDNLKTLTTPGVSENTITLGGVLDTGRLSASEQSAILQTWVSLFEKVNTNGGINGRLIKIKKIDVGTEDLDDVFALLVPTIIPYEPGNPIPVIGGSGTVALGSQSFRLLAGDAEQTAALEIFAATELDKLNPSDVKCGQANQGVLILRNPACAADASGAQTLLVALGVFSQSSHAARMNWPEETYVAVPQRLDRVSQSSQSAFLQFRRNTTPRHDHVVFEADAYSSGVLAIEALIRSGRSVTRGKFVSSLESIQEFDGAMTPALTFTPNRRTGSTGVDIVKFDPKTDRLAKNGMWIDPLDN